MFGFLSNFVCGQGFYEGIQNFVTYNILSLNVIVCLQDLDIFSSTWTHLGNNNSTVKLGNKELLGHPKIVP